MNTSPRAFTLVETLVAIAILMIAITGPLYAIDKALQATYVARDQLIATSLAQEGVEFVRSQRDDNYLYLLKNPSAQTTHPWLFGLDACRGGKTCTVDAATSAIAQCSGTCSPLTLSSANIYSQATSQPITRFTRSVTITDVSSTEVTIAVRVNWITNGVTYSTTVTDHLTNWL